MSFLSASISLVASTVLAAQAYIPKLELFLVSITNAPTPLLLDVQLANLLADDRGLTVTLWTKLSADSKVGVYMEPLAEMDLDQQAKLLAEAAAQEAAAVLAEQTKTLLWDGTVVAGEELATAQAVEVEDEESCKGDKNNKYNEEETLKAPKKPKAIGSSNPMPMVGKRVSKLATLSKCQSNKANKVIPLHMPPINMEVGELVPRIKERKMASSPPSGIQVEERLMQQMLGQQQFQGMLVTNWHLSMLPM
ncbi:hypothetical protein C0992_005268 [Termitomyces sp. T32_za158]|nr:hypothetical protein C0992_005268 [Termitomyces sp. T32_za158]